MLILKVIGVFVALVVLDILWARYIQHVNGGSRFRAAHYAAVLYLLGAFAVTEYVGNKWMLVPAVLGSWVGTYLGAKR